MAPALLFLLLAWRADGGPAARLCGGAAPGPSGLRRRRGGPGRSVPAARARARRGDQGERRRGSSSSRTRWPRSRRGRARPTRARSSFATSRGWPFRCAFPRTSPRGRSACSTPRDALFWAAPLLLGGLVAAALARLCSRSAAALGFLFLCIASLPTSNLLFPTGTIFAERLAYLPSAGFCLVAGVLDRRRRSGFRGALRAARRRARGPRPALCRADALPQPRVVERRSALHRHGPRFPGEREGALRLRVHVRGEPAPGGRARALRAGHADLSGLLGCVGGQGPRRADARKARGFGALLRGVAAPRSGLRERLVRRRARARGAWQPGRRGGRVPPGPARQPAVPAARVPDGPRRRRRKKAGGALRLAQGARDRSGLAAVAARVRGLARRRRPARGGARPGPRGAAAGAAVQAGARKAAELEAPAP